MNKAVETRRISIDFLTIFGTSNDIFHSARERKSVLICVCETHLQSRREMVQAVGYHTYAHTHTQTYTQLYLWSVDKTALRDRGARCVCVCVCVWGGGGGGGGGGGKWRQTGVREREREMNGEIREGE